MATYILTRNQSPTTHSFITSRRSEPSKDPQSKPLSIRNKIPIVNDRGKVENSLQYIPMFYALDIR